MPFRMVKIQNLTTKWCKDAEQQELQFIAGENAKWYGYFVRHFHSIL